MATTQTVRPTSGFYRQWLPRPAVAVILTTLIAALCCLSEANAGGKRKSHRKAQLSSAQSVLSEESKAAESPDQAASDRKVDKASAAKRGRNRRRANDRPLDDAVLRYLPENCRAFATFDVTAILQSQVAQDVLANSTKMEQILGSLAPLGLELEHVERITLGTPSLVGSDFSEFVAVLFCKQPPEKSSDFSPEGSPWTSERIGRTTLWVRGAEKEWAVCTIDDRVALAGQPDSIRAVLKRDAPAKLPEKLDHARRLTDPTAKFAVSFLAEGLGAATASMGIPGLADGVEAVNLEAEFDADLALQWALICRDDDSAQRINGMVSGLWTLVQMQGMQNQEPANRELLRSVSFDVEGPVFRATMKVPSSLIQFDTTDSQLLVVTPVPATASSGSSYPTCPSTSCPPSPILTPASAPAVPSANPYANGYSVATPYMTSVSPCSPPAGAVPAPYPVVGATWQQPAAPTLPALELADVVRLIEAGVDEEVIIRHVTQHHLTAPLSVDDLILLTESKATTKLITTLQEIPHAPKSKQKTPEAKTPEAKAPDYQGAAPQGVWDPYQPPQAVAPQIAPTASDSSAASGK